MSITLHLKVRVRFNDQEYIRLVQLDRHLPDDIDQAAINEAMETVRGLGPNPSRYAYKVVSVDDGVRVQVVSLDSMNEKALPLMFEYDLEQVDELSFFSDSLIMALDRARTAVEVLYLYKKIADVVDESVQIAIDHDGYHFVTVISYQPYEGTVGEHERS